MDILGEKYTVREPFDRDMFVPDCWVKGGNKIGGGHGEGKFYIGSKEQMRVFYGEGEEGFVAPCFLLKADLIKYMQAIKPEYMTPTQEYTGKDNLKGLWEKRMEEISHLDDIITFEIYDQDQIIGPRGYVNSTDKGFEILREISLPNVSYVRALKVRAPKDNKDLFYWKLFVDYDAIEDKSQALVNTYGKKKEETLLETSSVKYKSKKQPSREVSYARIGQGKYRDDLLEECPFCPITLINDERLLIASHIKPWAVSTNKEKVDPKNGYMLSPLYDKLFDRGLITFEDNKRMRVSNWLSPKNQERIGLQDGKFYSQLLMDEKRQYYLAYHREYVFKG